MNSISSYHDVKLSDPIARDNHLPGPTRLGDGDWLLESLAAARRGLTRMAQAGLRVICPGPMPSLFSQPADWPRQRVYDQPNHCHECLIRLTMR